MKRLALLLLVAAGLIGLMYQLSLDPPDPALVPTTADLRLARALETPVAFDYVEAPLADVLRELAQEHGIHLQFDEQELMACGYWPLANVTLKTEHPLPLRSALQVLMDTQDLTWLAEEDKLVVTHKDDFRPVTRLYFVGDLPGGAAETAAIIESCVDVASWENVGGEGVLQTLPAEPAQPVEPKVPQTVNVGGAVFETSDYPAGFALLVSNLPSTQDQIAGLIDAIRRVQYRQVDEVQLVGEIDAQRKSRKRFEEAMRRKVSLQCTQLPLVDFAEWLAGQVPFGVVVDKRNLEDEAVDFATPIDCDLQDVPLSTLVPWLLDRIGLELIWKNDVALITTQVVAEESLTVRVYPTYQLPTDPDSLIDLLVTHVSPQSWDEVGGYGGVQPLAGGAGLVISQTQQVHREIELLLAGIHRVAKNPSNLRPVTVDWSAAESQAVVDLRARLAVPRDFSVANEPLEQWLRQLAADLNVNLFLDRKALEDDGIDPAKPVHLRASGMSGAAALEFVLGNRGAEWYLQPSGLLVTTEIRVVQRTCVYPLPARCCNTTAVQSLLELITAVVDPATWNEVGGRGSVTPYEDGMLVVSQHPKVHRHLQQLLNCIAQFYDPRWIAEQPLPLAPLRVEPRLPVLDQVVEFPFPRLPPADALTWLAEEYNVPLLFPELGNRLMSMPRGSTLESALDELLFDENLRFEVVDGTVVCVQGSIDPPRLETVIYPLWPGGEEWQLEEFVVTIVLPPPSKKEDPHIVCAMPHLLVAAVSASNQRRIARLLDRHSDFYLAASRLALEGPTRGTALARELQAGDPLITSYLSRLCLRPMQTLEYFDQDNLGTVIAPPRWFRSSELAEELEAAFCADFGPLLKQAFFPSDHGSRHEAVLSMRAADVTRVLPLLIKCLHHETPTVRMGATLLVAVYIPNGIQLVASVSGMDSLCTALYCDDVQCDVAICLAMLANSSQERAGVALQALADQLHAPTVDPRFRVLAARVIANLWQPGRSPRQWLAELERPISATLLGVDPARWIPYQKTLDAACQPHERTTLTLLHRPSIDDEDFASLEIANTDRLVIRDTPISDRSVKRLQSLTQLELLVLSKTDISPDGAAELQAALPETLIVYYPSPEWRVFESRLRENR